MAEMIFGGIFFLVGFGVFLIGLLKPPGTIIENAGIAMAAGAFFALIGLLVIILGIRRLIKKAQVIKKGKHYPAMIWQYDADYSTMVNGKPLLQLYVRFFDDAGHMRQEILKTGTTSRSKYPLGNTVEVSEYDGEIVLAKKSSVAEAHPRRGELIDPAAVPVSLCGADAYGATAADVLGDKKAAFGNMIAASTSLTGRASNVPPAGAAGGMMNIACPQCGNVLSVVPGNSVDCSCGRRVTLTPDHMIL
ncbi:MAG: hypothetical protein K5697_15170 [Lachnospiraceae bacterium]|nr:hypothetical protein [Lachnospiraceae bacterium]